MSNADDLRKTLQYWTDTWGKVSRQDNFDNALTRAAKVTSVTPESDSSPAKMTMAVTFPPTYGMNPKTKQVHGGAVALLFDNTTGLALLAVKQPWPDLGTSRNLSVTYLRPPMQGEEVVVEAEVLSVNRSMAAIRGVLRRVRDGTVLAMCHADRVKTDRPGQFKL